MNIFDIVGPVMIGPSSSHTAGAVRIGRITRYLLNEEVAEAVIKLHGSFADTYRGHGTDKAIIGGLMGFATDDERIRCSRDLAEKAGLKYRIEIVSLHDAHPNTALIEATGISGKKVAVMGSSVGGGNVVIKSINGLKVEFDGQYHALFVYHLDKPRVIGFVTGTIGQSNINIAGMKDFRSNRGGSAIMIIETDQQIDEGTISSVLQNPNIIDAIYIEKI